MLEFLTSALFISQHFFHIIEQDCFFTSRNANQGIPTNNVKQKSCFKLNLLIVSLLEISTLRN